MKIFFFDFDFRKPSWWVAIENVLSMSRMMQDLADGVEANRKAIEANRKRIERAKMPELQDEAVQLLNFRGEAQNPYSDILRESQKW